MQYFGIFAIGQNEEITVKEAHTKFLSNGTWDIELTRNLND